MPYQVQQISPDSLMLYASVPISFQVRAHLRVEPVERGLGGIRLIEEPVTELLIKDFDADEPPIMWPQRFDVSNWAFFLASAENNRPVGGATVAYDTPGVNMLEGRRDMSVLWDIRVHPEFRGQGVGKLLFQAAVEWSRARRCKLMKIETQNNNPSACRFYAKMGAILLGINRFAYAGTPYEDETMLLWYKDLSAS